MSAPSSRRVWLALAGAPFVLAIPFALTAGVLLVFFGVRAEELSTAILPVAPVPGLIGFAAILVLTRVLARRDGLSWAGLGWQAPGASDVAAGLALGALVIALDGWLLHPLLARVHPSFDPIARAVPLLPAVAMLTVAVIAEDTLYRGYALRVLRARYGVTLAVLFTSIAYALLTPGPELGVKVWALGFGALLAGLRLWRGSLAAVVTAHLLVSLGPRLAHELDQHLWPAR